MTDETAEQMRQRIQTEFAAAADAERRERTAATVLAALLVSRTIYEQRNSPRPEDVLERLVPNAVGIADALRAALAVKP